MSSSEDEDERRGRKRKREEWCDDGCLDDDDDDDNNEPQAGPSSYGCQHCTSRFTNVNDLQRHENNVHPQHRHTVNLVCTYCSYQARNYYGKLDHTFFFFFFFFFFFYRHNDTHTARTL